MKIEVRVKPGAKAEKVVPPPTGLFGSPPEPWLVWVKEPAREGRANLAVIRAIAKHFGVAPSKIRITKGLASRRKTLETDPT